MKEEPTFGRAIGAGRKKLNLSQKELAARIKKEEGGAITPQYLNDIEHDRRSPSSDQMVRQFAVVLQINPDYLYYLAGRIPDDIRRKRLSEQAVATGMMAFRKSPKS